MSPAPTTEQATQTAGNRAPSTDPRAGSITRSVERPSSRYSSYTEGNVFRVSAPSNWRELPSNNSVTFAPEGAYGAINQQSVFTHGMEAGVMRSDTRDLQTATDQLVQSLAQSNPRMSRPSGYARASVGNRAALRTQLSNVSDATGQNERIDLFTAFLQDGTLFYLIGVAPESEFDAYEPVFRRVAGSLQFAR